jgi:hypothetical protein
LLLFPEDVVGSYCPGISLEESGWHLGWCYRLDSFACADDIYQIIHELDKVIGLIGRGDAGTASGGVILIYKV